MRETLVDTWVWGARVEIASYTFFLVASAIALVAISLVVGARRGIPVGRALAVLIVGLVFAAVGARLMHRITTPHLYLDDPGLLFSLRRVGLALYGGFILAVPATALLCRCLRIDAWSFADAITPGLGIAAALVRVGCLLNGCCHGKPTNLPWAVSYPLGGSAHTHQLLKGAINLFEAPLPVHPTQAYEAVAALAGTALAVVVLRRRVAGGAAFLAFVTWFTVFRWMNYYLLETSTSLAAPSWFYPALYAATIVACGFLLARRLRRD